MTDIYELKIGVVAYNGTVPTVSQLDTNEPTTNDPVTDESATTFPKTGIC